ncbi:glucose-methanol-choline oxidoreductase [Bombardia bombarda]|uniref:Glucose-methanol-choline oxidoreductase n=1 Tax=Bombardia bombarda TaxID=252184 RepID=A0AA39WGF9_9PEZI|nr:glucose-methanol-choline oxidoreductase [Bombardia bombarda]
MATPTLSPRDLHTRRLLGSSFGIPGRAATFDYVVVGGGTAGLAIATRLAEQQSGRVAVVEAGTFYEISNGNLSQVPATDGLFAGVGRNDWQPMIDWGYITQPMHGAYDLEMHYARGKTLGGSSARNYMAYQRGTKQSYKKWADLVGDSAYEWDNLLPFFEKSIIFTPPNPNFRAANATPAFDASVVGNGNGPLSVTFTRWANALATWSVNGLAELGFKKIPGLLSGQLLGQAYGNHALNATTMHRDSSETSFLRKALAYDNYVVYPSTLAKKIVFDGKKATGVLVETAGFEYVLSASKEVILSSGVFGSPQLLMVSGVGPASTLQPLGIPVVHDLPGVGHEMQDHLYFGVTYRINAPTASTFQDPAFAAQAAADFNERGAGPYADPLSGVLAWEKVPEPLRSTQLSNQTRCDLAKYPPDWPELELVSINGYMGNFTDSSFDPGDGYNYAGMAVVLNSLISRGNVSISSNDTNVQPLINPNYFGNPADIEIAVAGFKRLRQFWATKAMQGIIADPVESYPGPAIQTDEEIIHRIKTGFSTIWHGACTAKMGKKDDPYAVVDSKARVYGVENLRVVDASSFGILPPGHPMATVYAFAEKIACDITGC